MTKQDDVVVDIEKMLEKAEPLEAAECCIYRVPFAIRKLNEDAYTPKVVSIGPFHYNSHPRFENMERVKLIYCKAFLERTQTSLDTWIRYIEEVEPSFRRCYSDTLHFTKEKLVKIIFVDSAFIFELFLNDYEEWQNDKLLLTPWLIDTVTVDLLLLENQLPFFVLDGLFNLSFSSTSGDGGNNVNIIPSFLELTFHYFDDYNTSKLKFHDISISHFTDLIRAFHLQHPRDRRAPMTHELVNHLPSATELSEVGVRFKRNTESECLLDMKLSGRVLEIPQLRVEDWTELLFRNMVALEQCHYPHESYITDYVAVLDFLVNTSRDVDILVQKEVLVNWLGDTHSVANLFNGLMTNITQTNGSSDYFRICQDLNDLYKNRWNNLKSTLRRDYCNSPWKTVVSIAGIFLLILSLVQTVCSVLPVIHQ